MAGAGEMQELAAGARTDMVWEQWPQEPDRWYGRFKVYLALGPARTLYAAERVAAEGAGKRAYGSSGRWSEIAKTWFWRERANAWDVHQRELLALSERTLRLGLRGRRIEMIEDRLEVVCDVLDTANLPGVDEKQARAWLPQMRVFLCELLAAERKEFEHGDYERDDPANKLTITADDLRAAQRAYGAQASLPARERPEAALLARNPVRPTGDLYPAGRTVQVCVGLDSDLVLDKAALRAMRAETGLNFIRMLAATRAKFAEGVRRERSLGRPFALLHVALRATPAGIEFVDGLADGSWLRQRLPGVRILLLANWEGDGAGDWLKVVPHVITLREGTSHEDAAVFTQRFWHNIGLNLAPGPALDEALAHCPAAAAYVTRHW